MRKEIDLRQAINAISDVVQNRPRPVRQFDQIYMKTGDMVLQSEFVAAWADEQRLAFIGDGDAISICVAYLKVRGIVDYDFDERVIQALSALPTKSASITSTQCCTTASTPSRNPPGSIVSTRTHRGERAITGKASACSPNAGWRLRAIPAKASS